MARHGWSIITYLHNMSDFKDVQYFIKLCLSILNWSRIPSSQNCHHRSHVSWNISPIVLQYIIWHMYHACTNVEFGVLDIKGFWIADISINSIPARESWPHHELRVKVGVSYSPIGLRCTCMMVVLWASSIRHGSEPKQLIVEVASLSTDKDRS